MIGNDDAMTYEMFLRKAFDVKMKGGDPAHLASTDTFEAGGISDVKTGTAYAMAIYINEDDGSLDAELAENCRMTFWLPRRKMKSLRQSSPSKKMYCIKTEV